MQFKTLYDSLYGNTVINNYKFFDSARKYYTEKIINLNVNILNVRRNESAKYPINI